MCDNNRVRVIDQAVGKLQQIVQGQQALIDELTTELAKQRELVAELRGERDSLDRAVTSYVENLAKRDPSKEDVESLFPEGFFPPVV